MSITEETRKQMIAACQRTLQVLYRAPLPTPDECDEMYHSFMKALVNVPFTSERTKARTRRQEKEARRARPVRLIFPGGQMSNDSASEGAVKRFKSKQDACRYLAGIACSDSIKLALSEGRYVDVVREYNETIEEVRMQEVKKR